MAKKQADRRPDEKPARPNPARPDVIKDADRAIAEGGESRKGLGRPEGNASERPLPRPGRDDKGIFDGDRSDRDSGRPIQLDDDDAEPAMDGERKVTGRERKRGAELAQRR